MSLLILALALAGCAALLPQVTDVTIVGTPDLDTALRVIAVVCERPYAEVKDWGAYGDSVWTDPATGEVVFWVDG